jgi:UDPglucose--hexose-1-phosphate uridylyltransferase
MIETRKDYLLNRWVILAQSRKRRPRDFVRPSPTVISSLCVFCKDHEKFTPDEIGRVPGPDKSWSIRWFRNLFAAVNEDGPKDPRTDNCFFTFAAAYGQHEIIVETPQHEKQLWDFSPAELEALFRVYNFRISELEKLGAKYVAVFKNHGLEGGASIAHSHSQVISTNIFPKEVEQEAEAVRKYKNSCPYCSILQIEKNSFRRCFENAHAIAFAPYASRFNFEIWVFPKRHFRQLSDASSDELAGISEIMSLALHKLKELNVSYNYILHYLPSSVQGEFHFHIEITPRISIWAGFELNTGTIINSVTPEDAAKFYRGEEQVT